MDPSCLRILPGNEVHDLLIGREKEIVDIVRQTYALHASNATELPKSVFLRFPNHPADRMIALPAYLGGERPVAGIKWISSFPGNRTFGLARASAVIVLNSITNGRPEMVMEGSIISAKRTAASATLATQLMCPNHNIRTIGLIGGGVINLEVLRFLLATYGISVRVLLYDTVDAHAANFLHTAMDSFNGLRCRVVSNITELLTACDVISIATTETAPHIMNPQQLRPGTIILHISLRDLSPDVILSAHNVVDDVEHVCTNLTSIHLTSKRISPTEFIYGTVGDLILGRVPPFVDHSKPVIFSPFGLGVLDIALASFVQSLAGKQSCGYTIEDFFGSLLSYPKQI